MCSVLGECFLWQMPLRVKYSTETYYLLMVMPSNCSGFCEAEAAQTVHVVNED